MQSKLEDALDKLVEPRSSTQSQNNALNSLERTIAELVLVEKHHHVQDELNIFIKLQDSFQCNIASRILFWLAHQTQTLMKLGDRRSLSADKDDEFGAITSALLQALPLLQGVALMHKPSKDFLCRSSSIEVFIDLLFICRQASARPFANLSNGSPTKSSSHDYPWDPSLVSVVIDTLLCILVDAPSALRCFEEARGIEHIVKILKRPAIPKDIRRVSMPLFGLFYLMDESVPSSIDVPTRPSSPVKRSRIFPSHHSRFSTSSSGSSNSSGSASSFSSWSPSPTLAGTPPISPKKSASSELPRVPMNNVLDMLRKDVDFVPQSPKRAKVAQLEGGARRPGTPQSLTPLKVPQTSSRFAQNQLSPLSRLTSEETCHSKPDVESNVLRDRTSGASGEGRSDPNGESHSVRIRTIQEKREILGQLLGNVDALVEGVKKAGIWGLGE